MAEQHKLTADEIRAADVRDWRQILGRLKARFRTGDLATGLALVHRIGASVVGRTDGPEITITSADVVVALVTPEAGGITEGDLDLAREISGVATELGIAADASGLTQLELGLDTTAGNDLSAYYAALLGGEVRRGEPVDPSGQVPTVWWQDPTETDEVLTLPEQPFEQRWHFDVWVAHDEAEHRIRAVVEAGGRLVSDAGAPSYWVVEDADGNRSCICTSAGR